MPNLVGIGLSQVPTNSMLGGMAYQDPEHASIKNLDLKNLSQINSEIANTAVDVFVYDTSKDSDGGAWRKRTTHTSWYNETLGTAIRGTRKEFPAVAVIVATEDDIIIYDGDDPDLPMWMIFESSDTGEPYDTYYLGRGSGFSGFHPSITSVAMLNGILVVVKDGDSTNYAEAYTEIRFISDRALHRDQTSASDMGNAISGRNGSAGGRIPNSSYGGLVHFDLNDVAMIVLPNAPVDSATGLPVPTIAVATHGGVSVITDSGTVVDITSASGGTYNQSKAITITEENYLWWLGDYNAGSTYLRDSYAVSLDNFPSSDFTWNNSTDNVSAGTYYALTTNGEAGEIKIGPGNTWAWNHQERNALGGTLGLAIHKPNIGSETNSLIAAITSDYNTGWMHGNCKGAFLSDTDDTNKTNGQTDPDRSVNNLALTVTGTVTKSAVATGADLVAYSGFSGSNYLQQPYHSGMDFGTGDMSVSFWMKISGNISDTGYVYDRQGSSGNRHAIYLTTANSGSLFFYFASGGGVETYATNLNSHKDTWACYTCNRNSSGLVEIYINAELKGSASLAVKNLTNANAVTYIATRHTASSSATYASFALFKFSASIPTAEQIKKIYEDEKVLFQENAKATLYGSSDAVTALAYDEVTDLLHVGTSSGRSDFQGLRRINNTTTAVTTAISAHDGFIIEQ
jgi:hypothetical protein